MVIVLRRNGGLGRTVLMLLSVANLLGYLYGIVSTIHERLETAQATVAERTNFLNFKNDLGSKTDKSTDEFTVLWGYGTLSQCFGLRFGDIYTNTAFSRDIETLCPRDWMYDIWYKRVIGS